MSYQISNVIKPTVVTARYTNPSSVTVAGGNTQYFPSTLALDSTTTPNSNATVGTAYSPTSIVWRTDTPGLQVPYDGQYFIRHFVDAAANATSILSWLNINSAPAWRGVPAISNGATAGANANVQNLLCVASTSSGPDSGVSTMVDVAAGTIINPWNLYNSPSSSTVSIPANKIVVCCSLVQRY